MMFSLKISKNIKENLSLTTQGFAAFLSGMLFVFYVELMFPRFSGGASVITATAFFFFLTALTAVAAAMLVRKMRVSVQGGLYALFVLASLFFLPFGLKGGGAFSSVFITTQATLFVSAFLPLFTVMYPLFAVGTEAQKTAETAFLSAICTVGGILSGSALFSWFNGFIGNVFLTTLFVVLALCFAALYGCRFLSGKEETAADFEKSDMTRAALCFYFCLIAAGLSVAVAFRAATLLLPLPAYYLSPFVVCMAAVVAAFSKYGVAVRKTVQKVQPFAVVVFLMLFFFSGIDVWFYPALAVLAVVALCCFSALAESTKTVSFPVFFGASVSGGIVGALIVSGAPFLFGRHIEIPFLFVLAMTVRPGIFFKGRSAYDIWRDFAVPLALFFACFCIYFLSLKFIAGYRPFFEASVFVGVGALCLLRERPVRYALIGAVLMVFGAYVFSLANPDSVFTKTNMSFGNFFGQSTLVYGDAKKIALYAEDRLMGEQAINADRSVDVWERYEVHSGIASLFRFLRNRNKGKPEIGVVGIGTGTIAMYADSVYEDWVFFEPDADIASLAAGKYGAFAMYKEKTPYARIVITEPLAGLVREGKKYDMIVFDAELFKTFPVYLFSKEAVSLFVSFLKDDGILFIGFSGKKEQALSLEKTLKSLPFVYSAFREDKHPDDLWVAVSRNAGEIKELTDFDSRWR